LLDDLGDRRGYSHLKEEALDRIKWRNHFGRGCGPVVWQITDEWRDMRNAYRVLVGKLGIVRPLGRPRRRWQDNIKMDLKDMQAWRVLG
jgi:hypothetical protein